jgi:hypothetical protein
MRTRSSSVSGKGKIQREGGIIVASFTLRNMLILG